MMKTLHFILVQAVHRSYGVMSNQSKLLLSDAQIGPLKALLRTWEQQGMVLSIAGCPECKAVGLAVLQYCKVCRCVVTC